MNSLLPDDIDELKRLLAEQEALNRALLEKLNEREREIDHLQAQLDQRKRRLSTVWQILKFLRG